MGSNCEKGHISNRKTLSSSFIVKLILFAHECDALLYKQIVFHGNYWTLQNIGWKQFGQAFSDKNFFFNFQTKEIFNYLRLLEFQTWYCWCH